jgi:hypothetical protein
MFALADNESAMVTVLFGVLIVTVSVKILLPEFTVILLAPAKFIGNRTEEEFKVILLLPDVANILKLDELTNVAMGCGK